MEDLDELLTLEVEDHEEDQREAASMDATNHSDEQEPTILQREIDTIEQLGCPSLFYEIQQSLSGSPTPHLPIPSTEPVLILPPTGHNPATTPSLGPFKFEAVFTSYSYENWEFSTLLNKLYTDMDKWVQIKFHFATLPPHGLYIRALPMYIDVANLKSTVKRCPKHSHPGNPTNTGFAYPQHLTRFDSSYDMYCEDIESIKDQVLLVPVLKDDVQEINEFAEAAWICREPNEMEEIKETRRFLLKQVN